MKIKLKAIIIAVVFIVCLLLVYYCLKDNKTSKLENIALDTFTKEKMNYYDALDVKTNNVLEKYIIYAVEYNYGENEKKETSIKEIKKIIEKNFNVTIDKKSIEEIGVSTSLEANKITFDFSKKVFINNKYPMNMVQIAEKSIVKYIFKEAKYKGNKYFVTYDKYEIKNPYELINYFSDKNIDTDDIMKYLEGKSSKKVLEKYLTSDILKKICKKSTHVKVIFTIEDDKILIDSINE